MAAGLSSHRSAAILPTPKKSSITTWVRPGQALLVAPILTATTGRRRFVCKECSSLDAIILPYTAAGGELRAIGSILPYLAPHPQFVAF